MAADGRSFGISLGFYWVIAIVCFLFFGFARKSKLCKKYYAPKRYTKGLKAKPKRLPRSFWGWLLPVYRTTEEDLLRIAGFDAVTYMRIISFGTELFLIVTFLCCAAILPVNLVGKEVQKHLVNTVPPNNYTYWVPPPPPPNTPPAPPSPDTTSINGPNPPNFYDESPPAPPGLIWWNYKADVPPLPQPATTLGPNYTRYGWMYDRNWHPTNYVFNNMDQLAMSNVENGSNLLWVHALMTWAVSLVVYRLLWKYSKSMVGLRLRYLQQHEGVEPHTVLVQDIPGVYFGSMMHRLDTVVLRVLPGAIKNPLKKTVSRVVSVGQKGFSATAGKLTDTLVNRDQDKKPKGGDTFYEAPEALPSRGSIPSVHAMDPQVEAARQEMIDSQKAPLVKGGNTSVAPMDSNKWKPEPQEEPEMANEPPMVNEAYQSVTEDDPWAKAEALLEQGLTMQQIVEQEYKELFPGEVESVHVVHDLSDLNGLCKEYDSLKSKLEDQVDDYIAKRRRHKKIKRKKERIVGVKYGAWGRDRYGMKPTQVDALEFYRDRMEELRRQILSEQKRVLDKYVPSAFVSFKKHVSQVKAVSSTQHHDTSSWIVSAAPGPEEIIWGNLRWRAWERSARFVAVWAAFITLTLFYLIPIGAIQALINIDQLRKIHVFAVIIDLPVVKSIVVAILPGLILKIFLAILPWILSILGRLQGLASKSAVDFSVITKYFVFQVVTVFLGSFITGSFFNEAKQLINAPTSIITTLGTSAPLTSIFFLTFIELNALAAVPVGFLRIVGLVLYWLLSRVAATERAKARLWQRQIMKYGPILPQHTITILLGLVFCIMNPIIAPMCLVYFLIVTGTEKYNLLYVYSFEYQSGGQLWVPVFGQVVTCLVIFQLFMIGILGVKQSYTSLVVLPLLFITLIFTQVCSGIFHRPFKYMSLRGAVDLDKHERELASLRTPEERGNAETAYLAPPLRFDQAAHERLMLEARQCESMLANDGVPPVEHEEEDDDAMSTVSGPNTPRAPHNRPQQPTSGDQLV